VLFLQDLPAGASLGGKLESTSAPCGFQAAAGSAADPGRELGLVRRTEFKGGRVGLSCCGPSTRVNGSSGCFALHRLRISHTGLALGAPKRPRIPAGPVGGHRGARHCIRGRECSFPFQCGVTARRPPAGNFDAFTSWPSPRPSSPGQALEAEAGNYRDIARIASYFKLSCGWHSMRLPLRRSNPPWRAPARPWIRLTPAAGGSVRRDREEV